MELLFFFIICVLVAFFLYSKQPFFIVMSLIFLIPPLLFLFFLISRKGWRGVFIILVYLGGVLVLFLYVTSLNPKKSFTFLGRGSLMVLLFPLFRGFVFVKGKFYWLTLFVGPLFFSISETSFLVCLILFFLLLFLFFLSMFLVNVFLPFRSL